MTQAANKNQDKGKPQRRGYQPIRAPGGTKLNCQGWQQEAALRMLMNSLDEEVAEQPRELIACGTTLKVLRDWNSYHSTVRSLKGLKNNETLLVKSGKPVGVFETQDEAPRVLIATEHAAAGSWTYIGTQGVLPIAFQTFAAVAQKHFNGDLAGKLIVSGGLGAAGGALPLAAGLRGAAFLGIDVDGEKIKRRIRAGYCDYCVNTLDEALRILKNAVRQKQAVSVGLVGNCADIVPELASRGVVPDILTDQTSVHDLLNGYVAAGISLERARFLRRESKDEYLDRARHSLARHFEGMLALQKLGSIVFEFGNGIRTVAREVGTANDVLAFPDFSEAYLQPLFREGRALVQWVALSGEQGDIRKLNDLALKLFPDDPLLARWIPLVRKYVRFQGLPARVCWLGPEERIEMAKQVNALVAKGELKAPIVISVSEGDGSAEYLPDAIPQESREKRDADNGWPALEALLNTASGANWVSLRLKHGHINGASLAVVADGSTESAKRISRVLKDNSGLEILRLADANHKKAQDTARQPKRKIPEWDSP